jgi:hypothetical protein
MAHEIADPDTPDKSNPKYKNTRVELEYEKSEGSLLFLPQYDNAAPNQFSEVNKDVSYQKGNFIEQWTI